MRPQTAESFWARVKRGRGCWEWQGHVAHGGHGRLWWQGTTVQAHRLAAYLHGLIESPVGPKRPDDPTHILHRCDNPRCCNPKHFFLGTIADNVKDCIKKNRHRRVKGEEHPAATLSNAAVRRYRREHARGKLSMRAMAHKHGIRESVMRRAVKGITYPCA